jgi:pyruvate dehydrogenase E2 component (dihydrolipoamide acetyltransferase)
MTEVPQNTVPLTRVQKLIGYLMLKSKHEKPCCYMETHADITGLIAIRKRFCKESGVRVTTNDFFVHAIACAIKKHPLLAGKIDESGKNIIIAEKFGVGLAVAAAQGLVVPVIHDTAEMSITQVAAKTDELIKKARTNKLVLEDFDGANVVLSGLGMYGINSFLAITPPASTAIISIGKFDNKVLPINGEMVTRKMMSVALAVDKRIINEFYAARFLNCIIEQLENPECLIE